MSIPIVIAWLAYINSIFIKVLLNKSQEKTQQKLNECLRLLTIENIILIGYV